MYCGKTSVLLMQTIMIQTSEQSSAVSSDALLNVIYIEQNHYITHANNKGA